MVRVRSDFELETNSNSFTGHLVFNISLSFPDRVVGLHLTEDEGEERGREEMEPQQLLTTSISLS